MNHCPSAIFTRTVSNLLIIVAVLAAAVVPVMAAPLLQAPIDAPTGAWSNGAPASLVLGSPDFTSRASDTTQTGMAQPYGVAVDPTTGAVFVADTANHRVLRFASLTALSNGANAEGVLGQPNFTSKNFATSQSGMYFPMGLTVDAAGQLWVADTYNSRVLRFDNAASKPNGANADSVLGQPGFTSRSLITSQAGMGWPNGVAVDSAGRLWVVDYNNQRVLRFDNAASKVNGDNADGVLGQPNFTTKTPATSQSGMDAPWGVAVDAAGRLWVVDYNNNRVLRFDAAASKANGDNADGVLGQPNFTTKIPATSQSGLYQPYGAAVDAAGRLWVPDYNNSRVLRFDNAASKANGANADGVLGQPSFTARDLATSQAGMYSPAGVAVDTAGRLWVADMFNYRVLLFQEAVTLQQITRGGASPTNALSLTFQVEFDGPVSGLTINNFSLTTTGAVSGASVTSVTAVTASRYTVTVDSGKGVGTLRLDLANIDGLTPATILPGVPYTSGETYTLEARSYANAWSNGAPASLVLGQPDFTHQNCVTSQSGMKYPNGVAVDPTTGAVFVVDTSNHRVLRFASLAALANGANAEGVLGQPDFTSKNGATSQAGMQYPDGVAVDNAGRLWVADYYNNRVLRFDNAAAKPNGANADGVLGQPGFATNASAVSQAGIYHPFSVAVDSAGRLWVADTNNNRVLRFDNAAAKLNGANADGVLGQPGFTTKTLATSQVGINFPMSVAVDSAGRLWVADTDNHRVLRFDNAAAKPNGANADGVLGQPDFATNAAATSQAGMRYPAGMAVDTAGRLWVTDYNNSRVLRFDNAASKANGANADGVLGQPGFTTRAVATSRVGMYFPKGMAVDSAGRLWVADTENCRVLLFQKSVTLRQITRGGASPTNAASLAFQINFDGPVSGLTINNFSLTTTGAVSGASVESVTAVTASLYTVTVTSGASDGALRLDLTNIDGLAPLTVLPGVPYTSGETYTVDTLPPAAPLIDMPAADSFTDILRPLISGTTEPGAAVTVTEGSDPLCATTAASDGSWHCTPDADLGDGAHTLSVTAADPLGNVSPASSRTFTVDTSAPAAPSITLPAEGSQLFNLTRPTFSGDPGSAEAGATLTITAGSDPLCTTLAAADGSWRCTAGLDLPLGAHTVSVTQTDLAGHVSPVSTRAFSIWQQTFLPLLQHAP